MQILIENKFLLVFPSVIQVFFIVFMKVKKLKSSMLPNSNRVVMFPVYVKRGISIGVGRGGQGGPGPPQ